MREEDTERGRTEGGGQLDLVSAYHIGLKAIFAFSRVFICDINWKKTVWIYVRRDRKT